MKNANALVGQLRVMAAREQNEILREYLQQAVAALNSERGAELAILFTAFPPICLHKTPHHQPTRWQQYCDSLSMHEEKKKSRSSA